VEMIRQLIAERAAAPAADPCPADCCPPPARPAGSPHP